MLTTTTHFFCKKRGILFLFLFLVAVCIIACVYGSTPLTFSDFWNGLLWKSGYYNQSIILYYLRLPRVAAGILAGTGLALSGVLLQAVTGNPLASPGIIGVNSGAGFCCILLLCFSPTFWQFLPLCAFVGATATTAIILTIAKRIYSSTATVILSGIACNALLNAGISLISLIDTDVLISYNFFSIGGLNGVQLQQLVLPAIIILLSFLISLILSPAIQLLCLGDQIAASLGIRTRRLRSISLLCASASAAAAVSFCGLLGFVGLVIPHVAKRLCGNATAPLLIVSAISGSMLVVLADLFGRTLLAPTEIPVGIVMAFLGVPFLFYLLLKRSPENA